MFSFRNKKSDLKTYYNEKNDDDDDELFHGTMASEKLSSLFDDDSPSKHASTLKYVAPKQPLKETSINRPSSQQETTEATETAVEVLFATDGKLFSYKNSKIKSFGPVMCGIIYSKIKNSFKFLIYKTRTNIISQSEITRDFRISVQKNNYITLTDDSYLQWSVHINESHYETIITQVGICKAYEIFTSPCILPLVVVQYLSEGTGEYLLQINDEPVISYSSWKVENMRRGCQVDKRRESVKIKIEQGSWRVGLVNSRLNQRCLIFVQNGDSSKGASILAYQVSVESRSLGEDNGAFLPEVASTNHAEDQAKQFEETRQKSKSTGQQNQEPPNQWLENEADLNNDILRDYFKSQKALFQEQIQRKQQIETHDSKKASLISRMAKVGQPLLPTTPRRLANLSSVPTDSESDEERVQRRLHDNKSATNTRSSTSSSLEEINMANKEPNKLRDVSGYRSHHQQDFVTNLDPFGRPDVPLDQGTMITYQHPMLLQQQQQLQLQQQLQNLQQQLQILKERKEDNSKQSNSESFLSLLFSESRTQNTDLRMALSQLTQKVDLVYDKISTLETNRHSSDSTITERTFQSTIKPRVLLGQITDLVEQLENNRQKLEEKDERIDQLTRNYTHILQKNQKLLEEKSELISLQSENLESKSQSKIQFQELLNLQGEKIKTQNDLELSREEIKRMKEQLESSTSQQADLLKEIEALRQNDERRSMLFSDLEMGNQNLRKELESLMKIKENFEEVSKVNEEYSKKVKEVEEACSRVKEEYSKKVKEVEEAVSRVKEEYKDKIVLLEKEQWDLEKLIKNTQLELEEKENQKSDLKKKLELEMEARADLELELKSKDEHISKMGIISAIKEKKIPEMISAGVNTDPIDVPAGEPKAVGSLVDPETLGKEIMNLAYKRLKKEFSTAESYKKQVILENVVAAFRQTILEYSEKRSADGLNPENTSLNDSKSSAVIETSNGISTTDASNPGSTTTPSSDILSTSNDSVTDDSLVVGSVPSHAENQICESSIADVPPVSSTDIISSEVPTQLVPIDVSPTLCYTSPAVQIVQMKSEPIEKDRHDFSPSENQSRSSKGNDQYIVAASNSQYESKFNIVDVSSPSAGSSPNKNLKLDDDIIVPADSSAQYSDHSSSTSDEHSSLFYESHSSLTNFEDCDYAEDASVPPVDIIPSIPIPSAEDISSTSMPDVENGMMSKGIVPVVNVEVPPTNVKDVAPVNSEDEDDDRTWKTGPPPPPPLFSDSEDDDEWLP